MQLLRAVLLFACLFLLASLSVALPWERRSINFESIPSNTTKTNATIYTCGAGNDFAFNLQAELTLEMWLKPNWTVRASEYEWGAILLKPYEDGAFTVPLHKTYAIGRRTYGDTLLFTYNEATRPDPTKAEIPILTDFRTNSSVPPNVWTHIAVTFSLQAKTVSWYINGSLDNQIPTLDYSTGVVSRPLQHLYIGGVPFLKREFYQGQIDDLRIWNVARTEEEIREHMDCHLTGNETGLMAYYPFADTDVDYIVDYSKNENHCYPLSPFSTDYVSVVEGDHPSDPSTCTNIPVTTPPFGYPSGSSPFTTSMTGSDTIDMVPTDDVKKEKDNTLVIIIGSAVGGGVALALLVAVIVFGVIILKRKRREPPSNSFDLPNSGGSSEFNSGLSLEATIYSSPLNIEETASISSLKSYSPKDSSPSWEIEYSEIKVQKELGRGAFGVVYLGTWRKQQVAVKQLVSLTKKEAQIFLEEEAQLYMRLRPQQHVVKFLGVCSNPLCIVTEFIVNGSLERFIASSATITPKMVVRFGMDIASGMSHLHSEGIIHRDLAARNLLLDATMCIKITDFGMSRVLQEDTTSQLTQSMTGPLKWMAPESLTHAKYSKKSDVWMFGVTMIEILSRKSPFPDMTATAVAVAVGSGRLTPVVPRSAKPELAAIVTKCFAWEPADRPDFDEIFDLLDEINKKM